MLRCWARGNFVAYLHGWKHQWCCYLCSTFERDQTQNSSRVKTGNWTALTKFHFLHELHFISIFSNKPLSENNFSLVPEEGNCWWQSASQCFINGFSCAGFHLGSSSEKGTEHRSGGLWWEQREDLIWKTWGYDLELLLPRISLNLKASCADLLLSRHSGIKKCDDLVVFQCGCQHMGVVPCECFCELQKSVQCFNIQHGNESEMLQFCPLQNI